jgi:nitrous oxidase accessory protein NosD
MLGSRPVTGAVEGRLGRGIAARRPRGLTCVAWLACLLSAPSSCGPDEAKEGGEGGGATQAACVAGELTLADGSCQPAGVPPDQCGEGFEAVDGGCTPIFPADRCPEGLTASLGESQCREIMPCGAGHWGDIPIEPGAHYVDLSYTGGDSDGSEQRPWTTVGEAVAAAQPGALVAIAAGTYAEDLVVQGSAVRLWGVCPAQTEIAGTGQEPATVFIRSGADGTEIHGLSITGGRAGVIISGSANVVVQRLRVHDTGGIGVDIEDILGPTSATVTGSLIEGAQSVGLFVVGATVTVEDNVLRGTMPTSELSRGRGIEVGDNPDTQRRATVTVLDSVVDQSHDSGVFVAGSDVTIEGSLVRATLPKASDGSSGRGLTIQSNSTTLARANVVIRGSVVELNHDAGVHVSGSDATIEATTLRGTLSRQADQTRGVGLVIQQDFSGARANVALRASLVERNHLAGVSVIGADATVEAALVRFNLPSGAEPQTGRGIDGAINAATGERSNLILRASRVEQNHQVGVFISGSDAIVEDTLVIGTLPDQLLQRYGRGIEVANDLIHFERATAAIARSRVEQCHDLGIAAWTSDVTIEGSVLLDTLSRASDSTFGDGLLVADGGWVHVVDSSIASSDRGGLSVFGSTAILSSTTFDCNAIDINLEPFINSQAVVTEGSLEDGGGNVCGCAGSTVECKALSTGLTPPQPLEPTEQ